MTHFTHQGIAYRTNADATRIEWRGNPSWPGRWSTCFWPPAGVVAAAREAADGMTKCPWCGASGLDFDETDAPSDYCHHDT